ncbi:MAG TPA: metallophosphoesterase [Oscillatoriaceae cyanobacterium]
MEPHVFQKEATMEPATRLGSMLAAGLLLAGCYSFNGLNAAEQAIHPNGYAGLAANAPNPGVFQLADPTRFSQVVAISDVHGMQDALMALLAAGKLIDVQGHWAGGKTLLLVVGDSIDKGPKSVEVLDVWMRLAQEAGAAGGQVVHLLGNHEAEFLTNPQNSKTAALQADLQALGLNDAALTDPTEPRGAYIHQMPIAARVGDWLFCHAGMYPDMPWSAFASEATQLLNQGAYGNAFITGDDSILEAKNWWKHAATRSQYEQRLAAMGIFGVVQGHQPKAYGIIGDVGAIDGGHLIKIDNGMAPEAGAHSGHLLVFPHPAQMMQASYPQVLEIAPDGSASPVMPLEPTDAKLAPVDGGD